MKCIRPLSSRRWMSSGIYRRRYIFFKIGRKRESNFNGVIFHECLIRMFVTPYIYIHEAENVCVRNDGRKSAADWSTSSS